ncbi:hypothetical protein OQA88_13638 [Cercophora sp. LCS_1]
MSGLSNSRHAPWRSSRSPLSQPSQTYPQGGSPLTVTPAPTGTSAPFSSGNADVPGSTPSPLLGATRELERYTKIVRRMTWKFDFLAIGYQRATSRLGQPHEVIVESELMFKLDFFEFYMLLERALVHLLSVFRITISRDAPSSSAQSNGTPSTTQQWQSGAQSDHRYHANVLEALENPTNPFHKILGTGEVRRQLGRAKELRNRWKTAADEGVGSHKMAAPLESYEFERIFSTIFNGLDEAFRIAQTYVTGAGEVEMTGVAAEDEDWGFMTEAMDWEAI